MKRKIRLFIFLINLLVLGSCYSDIEDVTVSGIVIDGETTQIIKGAPIEITCWQYGETPDGSYTKEEKILTTTDSLGVYKWEFDRGAFIEVKALLEGYKPSHEVSEIHGKNVKIDMTVFKN